MAFSLSMIPTTSTLLPHTTLTTKGLKSSRMSRIVAQSLRNDYVQKKYEKVVKDLEPIAKNFLESRTKETEKRREYVAAREEAKMEWSKWERQKQEMSFLLELLGTDFVDKVDKDEVFMSLKENYNKVLVELGPATAKYHKEKAKRIKMGMEDESAEEMLAWESWEKKKQEMLEVGMKMYILRPTMNF